jgi:hypothetical protein
LALSVYRSNRQNITFWLNQSEKFQLGPCFRIDWEVARPYNFLLMPMVDPLFGYAFDRPKNQKIMLVTAFSSKQKRWFDLECINIYGGKKYQMVNANKEKNPPHNGVLPSQFGRLLTEYQEHPEAKSLARRRHAMHGRYERLAQACSCRCGAASLRWKGDGS